MLLSSVAGVILVSIFSYIAVRTAGPEIALDVSYLAFSSLLGLITQVFVLAYTIKDPQGEYLNFIKTILIAILYNVFSILVIAVIGAILVLIVGTSIFALGGIPTQ